MVLSDSVCRKIFRCNRVNSFVGAVLIWRLQRQCSLAVERLLRKQKVAGSIPVVGSSFDFRDYVCV